MSVMNCEEGYSALVWKFDFELKVQVMLHVQLFSQLKRNLTFLTELGKEAGPVVKYDW